MTKKEMIQALIKRKEFLASRVKGRPELSYDIAELKSLTWVIEILTKLFPEIVIKRKEEIDDENFGNREQSEHHRDFKRK